MDYFLGVDLGGTVVKASLFDRCGAEIATAGRRTPLITTHPGQAERDIEDTRRLTYAVIGEAVKRSKVDPRHIIAVATTGHGKGLYTLTRDNKAGVGIVSTDTRSLSVANRIASSVQFDSLVYPKTLQPFWPAHSAAILAWLKQEHLETYEKIGSVLWAKDILRWFLTDRVAVERTDISGSGLWNNVEGSVDSDLLAALGIPEVAEMVPSVLHSSQGAGAVTKEAASATGLIEGTPVFAGLFDVNACALATGLVDQDELSAVVGTWSITSHVSDDLSRAITSDNRYVIQEHAVVGQRLLHEASPTSAGNLEWFVARLLADIPEKERFAYCNSVVAETEETSVTFFPFLFGDDMGAGASGTMWGLHAGTDRAHIIRAVYEGIVFQHTRHLNRLLPVIPAPQCVRCAGGATRSTVWMQLFADVWDLPVVISTASELGALGAAICAAVGCGAFQEFPEAMAAMTSVRETYEPRPRYVTRLREKQERFAAAVNDMDSIWRKYA